MRHSLILIILYAITHSALSQALLKKFTEKDKTSNINFYADEACTEEITVLKQGVTTFYLTFKFNAKDFKLPFGKFASYSDSESLKTSAAIKGVYDNREVSIGIYYKEEKLDKTCKEVADRGDLLKFKIQINQGVNFIYDLNNVVEYGSQVYPLTFIIGQKKDPFGTGIIDWDLSDGGNSYINAEKQKKLADGANFTFDYSDDNFNDASFKTIVKKDIERRMNIKIYQMIHSERVPYKTGNEFMRRNSLGMTYEDLSTGECFTGGIQAYEKGTQPSGEPYSYNMGGSIITGKPIPCNRVDK